MGMAIDPVYRTPNGLTEDLRAELAKTGNAVLATINPDGSPHLTELLFLLDDADRVLLPTPHYTRKLKNVTERPLATVFFYEVPGWISCTGSVEVWTGERAQEANRQNRDRLLTEAGHRTIGRLLADQEDTTIVVTPSKWLSWNSSAIIPGVIALGGDPEADLPETWFKDLG